MAIGVGVGGRAGDEVRLRLPSVQISNPNAAIPNAATPMPVVVNTILTRYERCAKHPVASAAPKFAASTLSLWQKIRFETSHSRIAALRRNAGAGGDTGRTEMMLEFALVAYAVAAGFVAAGFIGSLYELLTDQPPKFTLNVETFIAGAASVA
eukprot:gene33456-38898_t